MCPVRLTTNRWIVLVGLLGHSDRFNMGGITTEIITFSLHHARQHADQILFSYNFSE